MANSYFKPINYYIENRFVCNKKYQDSYSNVKRIVVVGDIHGDFNILITCLKKAKVINDSREWIGGSTHVVQCTTHSELRDVVSDLTTCMQSTVAVKDLSA